MGGGLAGVSAANTVLECGGKVGRLGGSGVVWGWFSVGWLGIQNITEKHLGACIFSGQRTGRPKKSEENHGFPM